MPELRWTLLIIGALFVVGLALWEFRRQRKLPRSNANTHGAGSSERVISSLEASNDGPGPRVYREPTISLPELHPEPSVESRVEPRMSSRTRETPADLPVVELGAAEFSRLESKAEPASLGPPEEDLLDADPALDTSGPAISAAEPDDDSWLADAGFAEPVRADRAAHVSEDSPPDDDVVTQRLRPGRGTYADIVSRAGDESKTSNSEPEAGATSFAAAEDEANHHAHTATIRLEQSDSSTGFVSDNDAPEARDVPPPQRQAPAGATAAGAPIVDWPGEENRKIVALRLVSHPAARFQGRAVRQALVAEGFVLGKFDIFHKPGPDDRAVLSAASLTKPGTFAMNTIDAQRFGGISLFAVLPGPLPAQQTFDELLTTARSLNDRLQGALQDERGEPLTPTRSATIRQSLSEGTGDPSEPNAPHPETRQ